MAAVLFSGTSNPLLAASVANRLNVKLGDIEITRFIDNECRVYVKEKVAGKHAIVIQSLSQIADQNLVELCLIGEALKSMGVSRLTAVIPWLGYSKQDKAFRRGEAVSAHLVAKFIETAGFERVITVELHSETVMPYFTIPVKEVSTHELLRSSFDSSRTPLAEWTVISPDRGGKSRSDRFAKTNGIPIVYLEKKRDLQSGNVTILGSSENIRGESVIIFDDIINSGATAIKAGEFLTQHGAKHILLLATHAVLAGNASHDLSESPIDRFVVTDTIAITKDKMFPKLEVVSVAPLLAETIRVGLK